MLKAEGFLWFLDMTITQQEQESIATEERVFRTVQDSITSQISRAKERLSFENKRARALTSEILETRRVDDKALLASDEAVSHGLKDAKREEVELLKKQQESPYFARIELEEETSSGGSHAIEYKLGFSANTDCRIIDWRRAPISKLYYEYKEGEDYCEEILGRERAGRVVTRNRLEIKRGELLGIESRYGSFRWSAQEGRWEAASGARGDKGSDGRLPEILSLITAEQFRSITVDAKSAILIQGIAGSGKTTVAIHRLAWLLHHDNSPLKPHEACVIVLSPALRAYVENSLPSAGISGVSVRTYHEWAARTLKAIAGSTEFRIQRGAGQVPLAVSRVKRSVEILGCIDTTVQRRLGERVGIEDLKRELLRVLSSSELLGELGKTPGLAREAVQQAREATERDFAEGVFDWNDDALLLRIFQRLTGSTVVEGGSFGSYGHIVVDEVQDLSPVELATIIGAVKDQRDLTLVGDVSQNLDQTQAFPGWEALRKHWNFGDEMSHYVSLEVSHRSTLQIMRLADFIQRRELVKSGRAGRTPIWFKCRNESQGIEHVLQWLTKAGELYPNRIACVICSTPQEAKFAFQMLQPTFGPRVRLGDEFSFSFEEGILVTDVRQVKGLEFFSVLLWNPSSKSYPAGGLEQNLLYVAVTRAEENLCIVTWNRPSTLLPEFGASGLIRPRDVSPPEDDAQSDSDRDPHLSGNPWARFGRGNGEQDG